MKAETPEDQPPEAAASAGEAPSAGRLIPSGKRRQYLREYVRWLRPHGAAVGLVGGLALATAGLQMIEPLFMKFIIDGVLLEPGLDESARLGRLHLSGAAFPGVIVLSNLIGLLRDYRQRLLNIRVMLTLRRALFDRLLRLPLPRLWEMRTGGILSRLTGDIDTTTGLLQMAIISPALSVIRLVITIAILFTLNWRLALMALAIIPGAMLMSFTFVRRIRPIYRAVRKDVEVIDGRVGETFSGIRSVLRKEMFAHRRELVVWTSWGLLVSGVSVVIVRYGGYSSRRRWPTSSPAARRS